MDMLFQWIINNKEWIFSGIGVAILMGIGSIIRGKLKRKKSSNSGNHYSFHQVNKGTNKATQIGIQNNYGIKGDADE